VKIKPVFRETSSNSIDKIQNIKGIIKSIALPQKGDILKFEKYPKIYPGGKFIHFKIRH